MQKNYHTTVISHVNTKSPTLRNMFVPTLCGMYAHDIFLSVFLYYNQYQNSMESGTWQLLLADHTNKVIITLRGRLSKMCERTDWGVFQLITLTNLSRSPKR